MRATEVALGVDLAISGRAKSASARFDGKKPDSRQAEQEFLDRFQRQMMGQKTPFSMVR